MRKFTLLVSVLVHLLAVCVLLVSPLIASATLPSVYDPAVWLKARVTPPPQFDEPQTLREVAPSARDRSPEPFVAPAPDAALTVTPVTAPPEIAAEGPAIDTEGLRRLEASGNGRNLGGVGGADGRFDGVPDGAGKGPPSRPSPGVERQIERVGGRIKAPRKVHHVAPIYPPLAIASRTGGAVVLEAVIAEDGSVRDVRVLRSVRLLDQAAVDAVRQWRFSPTILNDEPVPIVMSVTVTFDLR